MLIRVRLLSNNHLFVYINQRYNLWLFSGLSLYMILFIGDSPFNLELALRQFLFLIIANLSLRLFDDLRQWKFDLHKPNRIYTNPKNLKSLYGYLWLLIVLGLWLASLLNWHAFFIFSAFLLLNLIIYNGLLNVGKIHTLLPLLKYPILLLLLLISKTNNQAFGVVELCAITSFFLAFIRVESEQDNNFIFNTNQTQVLKILSFILLLFDSLCPTVLVLFFVLCGFSLLIYKIYQKRSSYYYLLILLSFKIIIKYYVV